MTIEIINLIISVLTVLVVAWYADTTHKLLRLSQVQTNFQQRPIINLYKRYDRQSGILALRNSGAAPAYNIRVHHIETSQHIHQFYFNEGNAVLERHNDERVLKMFTKTKDGALPTFTLEDFDKEFSPDLIEDANKLKDIERSFATFLVTYHGIDNREYFSVFKYYSKNPMTDEIVIDFIKSDVGETSYEDAVELCMQFPKQESVFSRAYEKESVSTKK